MRAAVVIVCLACGSVWATGPVDIPDPNLKAAIEDELWVLNPTADDMLGLTNLFAPERGIADLTGLEYAANLVNLQVNLNGISDIAPLAGLTSLRVLVLNNNQISDISAVAGLTNLETLDVHNNLLTDISAVASLVNLNTLFLRLNQISDISALGGLMKMETLELRDNQISDIAPLAGMAELRDLILVSNQISDVSPLSGLAKLEYVDLTRNQISDISPLTGLASLDYLGLMENPLNDDAHSTYIPQMQAAYPALTITYDSRVTGTCRVVVSSTAGGTVVSPGEGEFSYSNGTNVTFQAVPKEGFVFVSWSGNYSTAQNPFLVQVTQDLTIQANFVSTWSTLYVDDDAPGDSGPGAPGRSDPLENGSSERPFDCVQEAIDVARDGTTIFVRSGTYEGNLRLLGHSVHLSGLDPNVPGISSYPILDGADNGPVLVLTDGPDTGCTIEGFVLTRGRDAQAGAILCSNSHPTFLHCLIVGNRSYPDGAVVHCVDSNPAFINCTLADNFSGSGGATLRLVNSSVTLTNSILWGNGSDCLAADATSLPSVCYCDVTGGGPSGGVGNLSADPLFVQSGSWVDAADPTRTVQPGGANAVWVAGDYHLRAQTGRWDALAGAWVVDSVTSPCVDAGDPAASTGQEPAPNGGRVNLGAYGGTSQSSKSSLAGMN